MLKNRRIAGIAAVGVLAALTMGSLVVASNMGFKGRFQFTNGVRNQFSPPYNSPYQTANDLLDATMPTSGGRVVRVVAAATPGFQFWTGNDGNGTPKNFTLKPGEGYELIPLADEDVVVVGSHNPFITIPAGQDGTPSGDIAAGFVANRSYLLSVPWHTTYLTAGDLFADVPGASRVVRLDQADSISAPSFFFWTGNDGNDTPKNFALELGRAYEVRVTTNTPSGMTPAHF